MKTVDLEDDSELSYASQEGLALVAQARKVAVTDQPTFESAGAFARSLKDHIERIRALFKPIKDRERAVWQATVDDEKRMVEGPQAAYDTISGLMTAYDRQQRELRAAEEKKAAELAAKASDGSTPMVVVPMASPAPKADGINFRSLWKAVVKDKDKLLVACCPSPCCQKGKKVDAAVLEPNLVMLNDWARIQKGNLGLIVPGVEGEETRSMATKRG